MHIMHHFLGFFHILFIEQQRSYAEHCAEEYACTEFSHNFSPFKLYFSGIIRYVYSFFIFTVLLFVD